MPRLNFFFRLTMPDEPVLAMTVEFIMQFCFHFGFIFNHISSAKQESSIYTFIDCEWRQQHCSKRINMALEQPNTTTCFRRKKSYELKNR